MGLETVERPDVEPITPDEVKAHARILTDAEDGAIAKLIPAARRRAPNPGAIGPSRSDLRADAGRLAVLAPAPRAAPPAAGRRRIGGLPRDGRDARDPGPLGLPRRPRDARPGRPGRRGELARDPRDARLGQGPLLRGLVGRGAARGRPPRPADAGRPLVRPARPSSSGPSWPSCRWASPTCWTASTGGRADDRPRTDAGPALVPDLDPKSTTGPAPRAKSGPTPSRSGAASGRPRPTRRSRTGPRSRAESSGRSSADTTPTSGPTAGSGSTGPTASWRYRPSWIGRCDGRS